MQTAKEQPVASLTASLRTFLAAVVIVATGSFTAVRADASSANLHGRFFMVVWSYQSPDNDVVKSHTFASFYSGDDLATRNPPTISWLPSTGVVDPFRIARGRNFSLAQTLTMACRTGREVKSWGPFEIRTELYQSALRRIQLLRSGRVAYSMMGRDHGTMNCIDAAGNLTRTPLDTGMMWGFEATSEVVRHLSPNFKNSGRPVRLHMLTRARCSSSNQASSPATQNLLP